MTYGVLGDLVMVAHFLFILFAAFGAPLALRWRRVLWLQVPSALWGGSVVLMGWPCPLTPIEKAFRERAVGGSYEGGFIEHYLMPLIYPPGLTREMQVLLGVAVLAINLTVYVYLYHKRRYR